MPSVSDVVGPASDDDLQLVRPSYPDMTPNPAARSGATVADVVPQDTTPPDMLGTSWPSLAALGRRLALGTRDVVEGASALPAAALDVVTWPGRAIQRAAGIPTTAPSTLLQQGLNAAGLPTPQTPGEQLTSTAVQGGAAMLPFMGAGAIPGLATRVPALTAPTARAAVTMPLSGGVGAVTGDVAADSSLVPDWLKPTVRLAGNMVGGGAANATINATDLLLNSIRGQFNPIRQAFDTLNIKPPTVSAVSGGPTSRTAEAAAGNVIGGQEVLVPRNRAAVDQFGRAVDDTASQLHFNATGQSGVVPTAPVAGQAAQDAIRDWRWNAQNPDSFVATQDRLYAPVNAKMTGQPVDPSGYRASLQAAAQDPALNLLPDVQAQFARQKFADLSDALDKNAPPGKMLTWDQAQAIRRQHGDMMSTPSFQQDLGDRALSSTYGGIAGDLERAADGQGVGNAYRAANAYSTQGHNFINRVLNRAVTANNPSQEIAPDAAARNLLNANGSDLQLLRQNIPQAADAIAGYKLATMDTPQPGKAIGAGDTSTETFATNLSRLRDGNPAAHDALFGGDPSVAQRVDALGTVAGAQRQTSQYVNPSRTAYTNMALSLIPTVLGGLYEGGPLGAAAAAGSTIGVPYGTARILTNPALIRLMGAQPGPRNIRPALGGLLGSLPGELNDKSAPVPTITVRPQPQQ